MEGEITYGQALELERDCSTAQLSALAGKLREKNHGQRFDTCSIMNARSGRCSEDCKWCSQSKFHHTKIDVYPLVGGEEALAMARNNEGKGVKRFSLVTSGRTLSDGDTEKICNIYGKLRSQTGISLCASLGLLGRKQMDKLHQAGVTRYHCNLESAPSFFPTLCTTHTTEEKIQTIRWARQAGMEVCSGGIIGMGESMAQRIELAITLRELEVDSIPFNVLNPIPGTALESIPRLTDDEIVRSVAMFAIINPGAVIRLAGGRVLIRHLDQQLLRSGVGGAIVGDMLTTTGSDIDSDRAMLQDMGFEL